MRFSVTGVIAVVIGSGALLAFVSREFVVAGPLPQAENGTPAPLAYDHFIRLKVLQVTKIEQTDRFKLLELKVQRWYGKIETKSFERAQEHETQEFTILFPAKPVGVVKVGDVIDYRAVRYISAESN